MNGLRAGLGAGLLYGIPVSLWLLGQAEPGPQAPDLSAAVPVLAGCQALMLLLLVPMGGCLSDSGSGLRGPFVAAAMLIMVPWPCLTLALGTGTVVWYELAWSQVAVALWALLLEGTGQFTRRLPGPFCRLGVATLRGLALLMLLRLLDLYPVLGTGLAASSAAGP